jgi:cytochrome c553
MIESTHEKTGRVKLFSLVGLAGLAVATSLLVGCKTTDNTPDGCSGSDSLYVCKEQLVQLGTTVYSENCSGCHGANGEGVRAPNVANSDFVMGSKERLIVTMLHGVRDSIRVNGVFWGGNGMAAWEEILSNREIAGVLTYIRATMNDSLYSGCAPVDFIPSNCSSIVARSGSDIASDSIPVWMVKAVRDTLTPLPLN